MRTVVLILIFSTILNVNLFAADSTNTTPAPYEDDEFPQGLKDLRRFEIIAFGSMPFVTLDVNIAYAMGKPVFNCMQSGDWSNYTFTNPLTASAEYSSDEIKGVIWTAVGISVGIALTDYIINLVKRNKLKKSTYQNNTINIYNITNDEDAIKLENPFEFEPPELHETPEHMEHNSEENTAPDSETVPVEQNKSGEN